MEGSSYLEGQVGVFVVLLLCVCVDRTLNLLINTCALCSLDSGFVLLASGSDTICLLTLPFLLRLFFLTWNFGSLKGVRDLSPR